MFFSPRSDRLVLLEFASAIIGFGGRGKELDNDAGVEQCVGLAIDEVPFAAKTSGIRIGVQAGGFLR
jgi:hypothetical protein